MITQEEKLCALLNDTDCDGVVAFFQGMSEKKRRALAPVVAAWLKKNKRLVNSPATRRRKPGQSRPPAFSFLFAYLATASLTELKSSTGKALLGEINKGNGFILEAIDQRRPDWVADWLSHLMTTAQHSSSWLCNRSRSEYENWDNQE